MPKPQKTKSEIQKKKLSLYSQNKYSNKKKTVQKEIINLNKPKKIILDEEDEKINEKINISQNSKKLTCPKYPKDDFSSQDSLSTRKTEDNQKVKSEINQYNKNVAQKNKKNLSTPKTKYSKKKLKI